MKRLQIWAVTALAILTVAIAGCQNQGTDASLPAASDAGASIDASMPAMSDMSSPSEEPSATP